VPNLKLISSLTLVRFQPASAVTGPEYYPRSHFV
jgi:hypothetical protein